MASGVAEPHHDATPHRLMPWYEEAHAQIIEAAIRKMVAGVKTATNAAQPRIASTSNA